MLQGIALFLFLESPFLRRPVHSCPFPFGDFHRRLPDQFSKTLNRQFPICSLASGLLLYDLRYSFLTNRSFQPPRNRFFLFRKEGRRVCHIVPRGHPTGHLTNIIDYSAGVHIRDMCFQSGSSSMIWRGSQVIYLYHGVVRELIRLWRYEVISSMERLTSSLYRITGPDSGHPDDPLPMWAGYSGIEVQIHCRPTDEPLLRQLPKQRLYSRALWKNPRRWETRIYAPFINCTTEG